VMDHVDSLKTPANVNTEQTKSNFSVNPILKSLYFSANVLENTLELGGTRFSMHKSSQVSFIPQTS